MLRHLLFALSGAAIFVLSSFTTLGVREYKLKTVVIDAGHGGHDDGTHGKLSKEKTIALAVAKELGKTIQENMSDVKVIYTRTTDEFIKLHDRANIANREEAGFFISIHCNSGPSSAHGTETWTMGLNTSQANLAVAKRENAVILKEDNYEQNYGGFDPNSPIAHIMFSNYQSAYIERSLLFASMVEQQFKQRVGRNSRGVKQAGFVVLYKAAMPSALIEIGFLSNPEEERYLNDKLGQTYIASGIYRALRDYKEQIESTN